MKNIPKDMDNRRSHMRVNTRLYFCISVVEIRDKETGNIEYGDCFCTNTADISLGGMCISHKTTLTPGTVLEINIPQKTSRAECLACDKAYVLRNELDLDKMYGKVVWATKNLCGIRFMKYSVRNENILSKFIWDKHLDTVRDSKDQIVRNRKF